MRKCRKMRNKIMEDRRTDQRKENILGFSLRIFSVAIKNVRFSWCYITFVVEMLGKIASRLRKHPIKVLITYTL